MPENLKTGLSTQAKAAIGGGIAALLAIGIGIALWAPWKKEEEPTEPVDDQQQDTLPPDAPEEPELSLRVGGEDVACTLYEGDGWSIYVPEGWETRPGDGETGFEGPDGAAMSVAFSPAGGGNSFVNLSTGSGGERQMLFCSDTAKGNLVFSAVTPQAQWPQYEKLIPALAKTLAVGEDKPFAASYVLPQEPDWQVAEGSTVLFLDKDGVILDGQMEEAVESYMRTWPENYREIFTGQYRINGIEWASSYTGLSEDFIDVFRARVQYRVAQGAEDTDWAAAGMTNVTDVVDGWATLEETVHLALRHDGGSVDKSQSVATGQGQENDWVSFAAMLK